MSPSHHTTYCVFSRCHAFIRLYILEKISGVDVKAQDILRKAAHAPRSSDWRGVQVWRISKARMVAHLRYGIGYFLHDEITILPTAVLESVQTLSTLIRIHGKVHQQTRTLGTNCRRMIKQFHRLEESAAAIISLSIPPQTPPVRHSKRDRPSVLE